MRKYEIVGVSLLAVCISIESCYAACSASGTSYRCMAGYYGNPTSATSTACTACPAAQHGGTVSSAAGSTSKTSCYEIYTPSGCDSGTVKAYSTALGSYSSNITKYTIILTPSSGYYLESDTATTCSQCPAALGMPSGWTLASTQSTTSYGANPNCYITGTPVGCVSGTAKKTYCDSDNGYCNLVGGSGPYPAKSGYYNTNAASRPVCTACPTADTGWGAFSSTGATSWTACYETRVPDGCAYGTIKRAAVSASAYSSTATVYTTLANLAGYYVNGTECTRCPSAENSFYDQELTDLAGGTSVELNTTDESACFLPDDTTFYDEYGAFTLDDDCLYDPSATDDFL